MKQNSQSKLQQALGDKKMWERVASSPDAKALAGMLTQGTDQASLQKIAESAARGDTSQLKSLIQSISSTPGGASDMALIAADLGVESADLMVTQVLRMVSVVLLFPQLVYRLCAWLGQLPG